MTEFVGLLVGFIVGLLCYIYRLGLLRQRVEHQLRQTQEDLRQTQESLYRMQLAKEHTQIDGHWPGPFDRVWQIDGQPTVAVKQVVYYKN